ncbi:protein of unknown function [Rhodovastum atsumiense]|nr:protein of unknown function [Rhodovastum atsumiense]
MLSKFSNDMDTLNKIKIVRIPTFMEQH